VDVSVPQFAVSKCLLVGKMPSHGDFVARGVRAREREELDAWLAASLASARDELGSRFAQAFDAAPPWRFAWHDDAWTAGSLTPSVDSAGRRFPLLVALKNLDREQVEAAATLCERSSAKAILERWPAENLLASVEAAEVARRPSQPRQGWWNEDLGEEGRSGERRPETIIQDMLSLVARQ
jgi:type VI secretion system protein ImpM